jgi:peptide/nickel transport system substrate-binding protein
LIRGNGETVPNGRANIPEVATRVDAWYEPTSFEVEAAAVRRLNKAALDRVVYAPLGSQLRHLALREDITGVVQGPLPLLWGVSNNA